jgi:hypothetical protein
VLQPIEWHTAKDGRRGLIAYSLGNFTSQMDRPVSSRLHGAVRVRLVRARDADGAPVTRISGVAFLPFYSLRRSVFVGGTLKYDTRFVPVDRTILEVDAGRCAWDIQGRDRERLMELQFYLHNMIVGRDTELLDPSARAPYREIERRLYGGARRAAFLPDSPLSRAGRRHDRLVDELEDHTIPAGGWSDEHAECLSYHRGVHRACVGGRCLAARLPAGDPCRRDGECASLSCLASACR